MKIGTISNDPKVWTGTQTARSQPAEVSVEEKKDTVEISQEARKKLAELADKVLKEKSADGTDRNDSSREVVEKTVTEEKENDNMTLTPARLAEIRKRISSGFYDRPEIKGEIIDRLTDDIDAG
jgi:hypothetical protein